MKKKRKSLKLPIILALDEDWSRCRIWVERLGSLVWGFKVGSILYSEKGPRLVRDLKSEGCGVFLDLKFHDIPNTVQGAVQRAFQNGADLLTVHAAGGSAMLELAAKEQTEKHKILAVTVLTSMDGGDLNEIGISRSVSEQVQSLARLAFDSGIAGCVCSPHEVSELRQMHPEAMLVTPGVRLAGSQDDQKRVDTPADAFRKGASMIVLGRALTGSKNWKQTWNEIKFSLEETSLKKRSA